MRHGIICDSETTPLRIVADPTVHEQGEASINQYLTSGPNILPANMDMLLQL
jgi:hypothetical protein